MTKVVTRVPAYWRCLAGAAILVATLAVDAANDTQPLADIAQAAEQYAAGYATTSGLQSVQATASHLDSRLRLTACTQPLQAFNKHSATSAGRYTVGIRCVDRPGWTLYVPVKVSGTIAVVTLRQALPRGTVLQAQHLLLDSRPAQTVRTQQLRSISAAVGKSLRRSMGAGQPLSLSVLGTPTAINRCPGSDSRETF